VNRREFARVIGLAGLSIAAKNYIPDIRIKGGNDSAGKRKEWTWIANDPDRSDDDWKREFAVMRDAGIDAILPEIYNSREAFYKSRHLPAGQPWLEQILPLAKEAGLEVHAWMWTMPCNVGDIVDKHPEWFVVNRLGESSTVKPAYVGYYKFLCPSRPEVWEFLKETVSELSEIDGLAGIHLDYVRYPDVILPAGLQPRYHIVQDKEYPQYDYCYCDLCRENFRKETGLDPLKLSDPSGNEAWKQFRYDRITHIVNDVLLPVAHGRKKLMTAAVFPNWENVRQEWSQWKLDGFLPMLYARFYNAGVDWIAQKTKEEVKSQRYGAPVYSGLSVGQLSPAELAEAVRLSGEAGGSGVSLFAAQAMNDVKWSSFKTAVASLK
jgi:uncharacterized lipoprotein YddW (UPF0748 family)